MGGRPEDYLAIHRWFDETKAHHGDFRHRALRHHTEGIFLMESIFGVTLTISISSCPECKSGNTSLNEDGLLDCANCGAFFPLKQKQIPTRWVGEQHVKEDLGTIPPATAWLSQIKVEPWMGRSRKLSEELEREEVDVPA